jgi:NNP family nitrate/nitrite transporter-like MFS transporter
MSVAEPASGGLLRGRWIDEWRPEDESFWQATGKKIANRNLWFSVFSEHIGFSIWSLFAVLVLFMPEQTYHIDTAGKFFLVSMPTLVGSVLRLPYTLAVAVFGGRNWTIVSAGLLLIPTILLAIFMHPGTSYTTFMVIAAVAGVGGGNFASSMTNINSFFPVRLKGWALGLNAGGGNIGVPVIQLVGLLVITTVGNRSPQIVCASYLVLVGVAALGAALFMDNLDDQKSNGAAMLTVLKFSDSWLISFLYIGTFGSFIGYSFAFGQVLQINYLATPGTTAAAAALRASQIAFLGPLLGSLSRPIGGWLADRLGGAKITMWCFVAMALATGILVTAGTRADVHPGEISSGIMLSYVVGFILLFLISGVGNGSVYKMIPSIFAAKSLALKGNSADAAGWERAMSGALIGIAGAIGALGGVGINVILHASYAGPAKSATTAFWVFLAFYVVCVGVTWAAYVRRRGITSLA